MFYLETPVLHTRVWFQGRFPWLHSLEWVADVKAVKELIHQPDECHSGWRSRLSHWLQGICHSWAQYLNSNGKILKISVCVIFLFNKKPSRHRLFQLEFSIKGCDKFIWNNIFTTFSRVMNIKSAPSKWLAQSRIAWNKTVYFCLIKINTKHYLNYDASFSVNHTWKHFFLTQKH